MKKFIFITIVIFVALGGWFIYKFPYTKHEVMNQVKSYLNKREDAYLINSEDDVYNYKMGTYLINVRYKDEQNMKYTYAFDKDQHKVYLYRMDEYKNGKSRKTLVGLHDSMYFKDQQE